MKEQLIAAAVVVLVYREIAAHWQTGECCFHLGVAGEARARGSILLIMKSSMLGMNRL
jgi:hypothetical protein